MHHDNTSPHALPVPTKLSSSARRRSLTVLITVVGLGALAGCTAAPGTTEMTAGPTTSTAATAEASTAAASETPPQPSSSDTGAVPSPDAAADGRCTTDQLTGSTTTDVKTDADLDVAITLTNTSGSSCTVQGWPGASIVGGENGTQLGRAAALDKSAPHPTVTLAPNGQANFVLRIVRPTEVSNAICHPRIADGFRVIPPGETRSLFVEAPGYGACAADIPTLLTVTALLAGPAA